MNAKTRIRRTRVPASFLKRVPLGTLFTHQAQAQGEETPSHARLIDSDEVCLIAVIRRMVTLVGA